MNTTATRYKTYTRPPLPFRGNKRMWVKQFTELLKANYSDCDIVVDLFGGSGFCSYLAKKALPAAEVVYNDFDYYIDRINKIPQTNEIIARLRQALDGIAIKANIGKEKKKECLTIINEYENPDYLTISTNILFSGKYADDIKELEKPSFYKQTVSKDYDATGYLDGMTITHVDWRELYYRYKDCGSQVLFLFDPPYMNTDASGYSNLEYSNLEYSNLKENIGLIKTIFDISESPMCDYILFTSEKSGFTELFGLVENLKVKKGNISQQCYVNYQNSYRDYLLYKVA